MPPGSKTRGQIYYPPGFGTGNQKTHLLVPSIESTFITSLIIMCGHWLLLTSFWQWTALSPTVLLILGSSCENFLNENLPGRIPITPPCDADISSYFSAFFWLILSSWFCRSGLQKVRKGKLGAHAMKRVAAGAHLPTPGVFEPAKRPDDSADYCLGTRR